MNVETITECMELSFADRPFADIVGRLAAAGVAAYGTDLIAMRKTYYDGGTETMDQPLPLAEAPEIPAGFDAVTVEASLRSIQQREVGYAEFLRRIMRAGCARYYVFFGGGKAVYFGRDGDFYVEPFPAAAN